MTLGSKEKKILEILQQNPDATVMEIAAKIYGKPVLTHSNEYNSTCRSFTTLEQKDLIEKEGGQVKWHIKPKKP